MSDPAPLGAGVNAVRMRLYGANGLPFTRSDIGLLRGCLLLDGVSELSLLPDMFGYDVDMTFRIDEPRGVIYVPGRLARIIEAALYKDWGHHVTQMDLLLRAVY
jgi:hypothetical protein